MVNRQPGNQSRTLKLHIRSAVSQSHPQRKSFCTGVSDVPCFFFRIIDSSPTTGLAPLYGMLLLLVSVAELALEVFEFCEPILKNYKTTSKNIPCAFFIVYRSASWNPWWCATLEQRGISRKLLRLGVC